MNITDVLAVEHVTFCAVFDQIERVLPSLRTRAEIQMLVGLVESLLRDHGDAEQNLAYLALDHVLKERGQLDQLYQDHKEMDVQLKHVRRARTVAEARRLLRAVLVASREHFRREERTIFPLMQKVLQSETLEKLGELWVRQQRSLASRATSRSRDL
ncbi:MAG: hemerythrin domain-containing protein [Verrucomicrobiae bacterium]|nr:hemerythrin domain-containing protein [Verrucomicrobiae bacterium]